MNLIFIVSRNSGLLWKSSKTFEIIKRINGRNSTKEEDDSQEQVLPPEIQQDKELPEGHRPTLGRLEARELREALGKGPR